MKRLKFNCLYTWIIISIVLHFAVLRFAGCEKKAVGSKRQKYELKLLYYSQKAEKPKAAKMIAETIGLILKNALPRKKPSAMFKTTVQNFAFFPFEKIRKTTAAIQKNARITATINCL